MFWAHQYQTVFNAADLGSIQISLTKNILKFDAAFKHPALNAWLPCTKDDVTWTNNLDHLEWEWKVMIHEKSI